MHFLFVLDEIDNLASGVVATTLSLTKELSNGPSMVTIIAGEKKFSNRKIKENLRIITFPCFNFFGIRIWFGFFMWFVLNQRKFEYISFESLWLPANLLILFTKILIKKSYFLVITTHGMLTPSSLFKSKTKKMRMIKVYQYFHSYINFFRVMSKQESLLVANYFPFIKQAFIPNALPICTSQPDFYKMRKNNFVYLGRINPIKRIDVIICAYTKDIHKRHGKLLIHGPRDDNLKYMNYLKRLNPCVEISRPVYGDEKNTLLNNTNILILASLDEGLPMILLEGLRHGCHILITKKLYDELFSDFGSLGFIHVFDGSAEDLTHVLDKIRPEHIKYRYEAFQFVNKHFSVEKTALEIRKLVNAK